jgi:hypothetical protein
MEGREFNYLKLRNLIEEVYGRKAFSLFQRKSKIDRTSFNALISGRNTKGPTAQTWNKIIAEFSGRGVMIKINEFYGNNKNGEESISRVVNEDSSVYHKTLNGDISLALSELIKTNENMRILLEERNEMIIKQDSLIRNLKKEVNSLKRQLKAKK